MSLVDLVVARQAIFDRDLQVNAYELLFRSRPQEDFAAAGLDSDLMTANVLFTSISIGIERLAGNKTVFCNADRGLLTGAVPIMLPPEQTVIEVLETISCDEEILRGCRRLREAGYRLALDDFLWFEGAERMLEIVSIVKIDLRQVSGPDLPALVARCREFDVELVAEKVETEAELATCLELGFDYFQGYLLERPRNVSGKTLSGSALTTARIASGLLSREVELAELEDILRTDPGLSFQLLQLAGMGTRHGLRRRIRTLRDALVLVGPVRVQNWLALLMLRKDGDGSHHNLEAALTRARMCELLAQRLEPALGPVGFTAGILSALDLMLGVDVSQIIGTLPLDDELREAAFGHTSPLARVVRDVIDYQTHPAEHVHLSDLDDLDFDSAAYPALAWALEASQNMSDAERATPRPPAARALTRSR